MASFLQEDKSVLKRNVQIFKNDFNNLTNV